MNHSFWQGKKVFLTGHTGFKGSWLALWLQHLGAEVTGYALQPPTAPNLFELADVAGGMTTLHGDVRDLLRLKAVLAEQQPQIIFHLAAQSLVRHSYAEPVETFATNVMGVVNMLEAVRHCSSVRAVVTVTSDKCYQNQNWLWSYRENEPMGGHDPYSSSKGCAELVTAAYRNSFFAVDSGHPGHVALASARAGNVIGGGDWAVDRLVPDTLHAFMENQPVRLRNPRAIRPWQHVLEPLSGYLRLAERLYEAGSEFAEGWNFGPREEDARPVGWVVDQLAELWGGNARWELAAGEHPHEAVLLKLDCSKSRSRLGWQPRLGLPEALAWTVQWHQGYRQRTDLKQLTLKQIHQYEELNK